jgi:CheY-like chemotaxis protein
MPTGWSPNENRAGLHRQELAARRFAMARILVIDDYEPFRASVKDLLEASGYDVTVAVDGEDGIRQFQLQPFDLVLCDLFMPKKEGMETIRTFVKSPRARPSFP